MTNVPANIVYLCANPGLDLDKMLGPKIHIQAILRGLKSQNINPTLVAVQKSDAVQNYTEFETVILPHRYMRGFVHRIVPYTGIVDSLRIFLKIVALNRTKHFALIHERYTGLSWGGVLAAKFLRIPLVLQMVGPGIEEKALQLNPLKPSKRWLALLNQKYLFANCNHLILVSKLIASFIYAKRGWRLPKYSVILNGSDIPEPLSSEEKIAIRRQFGAEDRPLFIYSGSLYRWYGTLDLVKAFHMVLQKRPDLKLIIVGSGEAQQEISNYIQCYHLNNSIIMTGVLTHDLQLKYVQSADFCLVYYPGAPTYHGSSTKAMECMASGHPVICTPQMVEVIRDGITGFMSNTSDPEDFAKKILEVLDNPEEVKIVAENGRQLISNKYTWNHYLDNLADIYASVISTGE